MKGNCDGTTLYGHPAETALWSLQDVESFKINFMSSVQAAAFVDELLLSSVRAISEDPKRYRPNQMLADNGLLIRSESI